MRVYFTIKAEKGLEKIYSHVQEHFTRDEAELIWANLKTSILKLEDFPELGVKIAGQADKRVFYIDGNAVIYEIVLKKEPIIAIRNIRPRRNR